MAARRRAHPAKAAKSHIIERGSVTEDDTTASILRTSLMGTSGFTLASSVRSPAAISDGRGDPATVGGDDHGAEPSAPPRRRPARGGERGGPAPPLDPPEQGVVGGDAGPPDLARGRGRAHAKRGLVPGRVAGV